MFDLLSARIFGNYGPLGWSFKRFQYKRVWNFVSKSESNAKMAVAGTADEERIKGSTAFTVQTLQRCVGVQKTDVVLEIGAGVGRVGAAVAPLCRQWIGTDVSENMVRHIKRRLAQYDNVQALATNGYDLNAVASNSIDLVYCTIVLMHLSQWERYGYIKEAFRVLKPGGRLLVDSVNIVSDAGWRFFEDLLAIPPHKRPPNISELSTPEELITYLKHANFESISSETHDMWIIVYGRKPI
jgi:ubiquinone/menaquinone biosynthesis C-methylase UbiE